MKEADLRAPVTGHLERRGFQVWPAPDGADYFDLVARRGDEVGLVELKLADWRKVFAQALRRRAWADWAAVALPRPSLARKVLELPQAPRARCVGVWAVVGDGVEELRAARPFVGAGEPDPFAATRVRFRALLDDLVAGRLPPGAHWEVPHRPTTGTGHRTTRDWRLEEFPEMPDGA